MSITGKCRCGAIRYELALDQLPSVYCCHCRDCQTWSGTAFVEQAVIAEGTLRITQGVPVEHPFLSASGVTSRQKACGDCFTRLYTVNPTRPGVLTLRAGTLDRSEELRPALHIWTKRMQPWIALSNDLPAFAENAPVDDFAAILRRAAGERA
jgi:hypothetical protein